MEPPRPGDSSGLIADAMKAENVLGWTPRQSDLTTIVRSAWNWHLQRPQGYETE
jgi:UDP-glucose 4-epimerase